MEVDGRRSWTLLTSHGHVLVEIARNPKTRVRDISAAVGITDRATQAIIAELERAGYVERIRVGRRTHYKLHTDNPFRHSAQDGLRVGPFLELLTGAVPGVDGVVPDGLVPDSDLVALAGLANQTALSGSTADPTTGTFSVRPAGHPEASADPDRPADASDLEGAT